MPPTSPPRRPDPERPAAHGLPLLPDPPAPDEGWLRQFTAALRERRPQLPLFSARQMALQAFPRMHLLTPGEASEWWDQRMLASHVDWRRLGRR